MAVKFSKLTRNTIRATKTAGDKITEHGITFERLANGDGRYSVNVMVDGERIHRVIGLESDRVTRKQAENFIEKARTDARAGRLNLPKGRKLHLSFQSAVTQYLSKLEEEDGKDIPKKGQRLRHHLTPFFGKRLLSKITTFDIERYKKARKEEGAAAGSVNRELAVISHLFSKAVEWKWIDHKPATIKRLPENNAKITYLTPQQIEKFLRAAKEDQCPHLYPFIFIGVSTSMRRSEILSIQLKYIDLERKTIYVPRAKAGPREQPITPSLAEFLRDYVSSAEPDQVWLFPSTKSRSGHVMNIEKPWKRVAQAAGLDPREVVRHTLRHTAITHLVQGGVDLPTVKRISGHKTLSMVERYSHQNGEHIQSAMDKLDSRYETST